MSIWETIVWWTLLALGLAGSAMYSGLETGAYSLNRVRLHVLEQQRAPRAVRLARLMAHPGTLLTTLLIGNNIANYLGTASLTVILADHQFTHWQVIIINVLVITPLLFVLGETIPKDLFTAHSDTLMYRFSGLLVVSQRLFQVVGLLGLVSGLTRLMMRLSGKEQPLVPFHPRRQVELLLRETVGYGLLSHEQSAIVERVLELSGRQVRDEMVPWSQVIKVNADDPPQRLWELANSTSRSRFPVVDRQGKAVGTVHVIDALLHQREQCPPIKKLMKPPITLAADTPLRSALGGLQKSREPLAIVIDHDQPVGIVTVKDLVEPITGELTSW